MGDAAGETWGISDPTFLLAYLLIAAAVLVAGTRARRALAGSGADRPGGDPAARPHSPPHPHPTTQPHDVAYLNRGPELAVYSALTAMHLRGTIDTTDGGAVTAAGRLDRDAVPLERAIHFTAAAPVARHRLQFHRPVGTALRAIEDRLVAEGLLLSPQGRRAIRAVGWWSAAVAGLGLVRLLASVADAKPVGALLVALLGVTAVAAGQLACAPRRSRAGDALLRGLRREHHALSPDLQPDWATHGPTGAALGVGVFGVTALWASDPAFAVQLDTQKAATAYGGGGGASGDGGWSGSSGDAGWGGGYDGDGG